MVVQLEGVKEIEALIGKFTTVVDKLKARGGPRSDILYWQGSINYYKRMHEANLGGKPIALTGFFGPQELFHAMDVANYVAENHGVLTAQGSPEMAPFLFETAESYGIPADVCSPHRAAMGISKLGMVPRPTFVVSTATTCDQTIKLYEVIAGYYKAPSFLVDTPYNWRENDVEYARRDIKSLIKFVEDQTGRKLDYDRLKEVLRLSSEAYDYWEKGCELRKAVPCPINGRENLKDFAMMLMNGGRPEAVDYFKARYEELKDKVDRGEGAIPVEKYRVAWLYVLPLFDLRIADWMAQELQALIVVDNWSFSTPGVTLDPNDPVDYLARKPLKWGFATWSFTANEVGGYATGMADLCRDYKADVAIALIHWSCQQYCGNMRMAKDEIQKLGIPFLGINGDLLDARVCSSDQMKAQIAEFFSLLEKNK
ncbi:MAG: 2-hydroxyacyl-CoA dehydratase [Chloroflexi bacterium]|nr:2-hydroxyacyl-CoA dehydratase [Chloroflexota bacterium]